MFYSVRNDVMISESSCCLRTWFNIWGKKINENKPRHPPTITKTNSHLAPLTHRFSSSFSLSTLTLSRCTKGRNYSGSFCSHTQQVWLSQLCLLTETADEGRAACFFTNLVISLQGTERSDHPAASPSSGVKVSCRWEKKNMHRQWQNELFVSHVNKWVIFGPIQGYLSTWGESGWLYRKICSR